MELVMIIMRGVTEVKSFVRNVETHAL